MIEEKFYTIDKIADMLGMHHKTIRKFITEGKLRANKVGKQWRISGHDLSVFMENNDIHINHKNDIENEEITFANGQVAMGKPMNKINLSTVLDINEVDIDESRRISNMLLALMNSRDPKMSNSTLNIKHYPKEKSLKVMLWGDMVFTKEMLDLIELLTQNNDI